MIPFTPLQAIFSFLTVVVIVIVALMLAFKPGHDKRDRD